MSGLTEQGFDRKTRVQIEEDMKNRAKNLFGNNVNLSDDSPLGKIIKNTAYEVAQNWYAGEDVYNSSFVDFATGVSLDYLCKLIGISRREAVNAEGTVIFSGTEGTIIPEGYTIETEGEEQIQFETTKSAVVNSFDQVEVPIQAIIGGADGNVSADTITSIVNPISGVDEVSNPEPTTGGRDRESDYELRERFYDSVARGGASTVDAIRASLLQLENVTDAIVQENNTMETSQGEITVTDATTTSGDIIVSINSLSEIDASHYNLQYTVSIIDTDTDVDIATKIADAINADGLFDGVTSSSNVVTINDSYLNIVTVGYDSNTTDSSADTQINNIPSKAIECFVYGGADADIYQSIFDTKAAGIMAFGKDFYTVEDGIGNSHHIGFSRPTFIDIWVSADITTNSDYPADGNTQVQTEIIKYIGGVDADNTEYQGITLGEDVIRTKIIAAIHNIDGITDVDLQIGESDTTLAYNNITIGAKVVAITDDTKVDVV